jgi:hypothetical protein
MPKKISGILHVAKAKKNKLLPEAGQCQTANIPSFLSE